jgi:hypothetical protein
VTRHAEGIRARRIEKRKIQGAPAQAAHRPLADAEGRRGAAKRSWVVLGNCMATHRA